ncbi:hypothetical protein KI387_004434, partial [Taxus chinensis]
PVTYKKNNKSTSIPLVFLEIVGDDSPTINTIHCGDDDSILTYLGVEDSYLPKTISSDTSTLLNEATVDLNIGTSKDPRIIKVGQSLNPQELGDFTTFLSNHHQAFAWSYKDMPGLDPDIMVHNIITLPDIKLVKQKLRKMHPPVALLVKEELQCLISANFIRPIDYPQWVSNVVLVTKATGKIQICTDFWDLNLACPKDDFPLPNIDQLVDLTAGHEMLSLMDGFSG